MITEKVIKALEYDKVLEKVASYAVSELGKDGVLSLRPSSDIVEVKNSLDKTAEAVKLLFTHNVQELPYYSDISDEVKRALKGGTLSFAELLRIAYALRSARIIKNSILSVSDESIILLKEVAERLFVNQSVESEITDKILSEDTIADSASVKLFTIRKQIRTLNARIREKLNSYMHGSLGKYMQDNIVTVRGDRYVVPIRAEYRSQVKGLVHDQSSSGATVFIEPEQIIEYNNELKTALIEEANEIRRILQELSEKVAGIGQSLLWNTENLIELDVSFSKAAYAYKNSCIYPKLNDVGHIEIIKGRHPLINEQKVVPVTVKLGNGYNFLLITGPNTGGKTVTLKLTGLLSAMMMSGLFVPCAENSVLSVFNDIFCDIGDEQSIEQNLSTFSSHMKNIIEITENVTQKALVLLDEIGAGTDPDEGSGIALAVIEELLEANCFGIITTHYSRLKEYAFGNDKIENASMDFDTQTFAPLYKLNIGIPGSSNAIEISKRLGLSKKITDNALSFLSDTKISFENILKQAEESRNNADKLTSELEKIEREKHSELALIRAERERLEKELEKVTSTAKIETRRIVNEKVYEAEELLEEIKSIAKKSEISGAEVITARKLKNAIEGKRYLVEENNEKKLFDMKKVELSSLKAGDTVYSEKLDAEVKVLRIFNAKKQVEVALGMIKTVVAAEDLFFVNKYEQPKKPVQVKRTVTAVMPSAEINILGQTVLEGVENVAAFIDKAVLSGLEEIKIIHGVGTGKLKAGIWDYLRTDKRIKEYRSGRYGEGEKGVTIITLK